MVDFIVNARIRPDDRGARRLQRQLGGATRQAQRLQRTLSAVRETLGGLFIAAAAFGGSRVIASFEQQMAFVAATTRATEQEFESLNDEARRLGATTRFSAREAADGLLALSRAGFTANQSVGALESTLQLALAGNVDLGLAANIASNLVQAFQLEVSDLTRVVDVLANAANSSNVTVQDLGLQFQFVSGIAKSLGISIEETTAAISVLGNRGQIRIAGTALNRAFSFLQSPTTQNLKFLQEFGLTAEDTNIKVLGLVQVLKNLIAANIDLTRLRELAGFRGAPGVLGLIENIEQFQQLAEANRQAEGTGDRFAAVVDNTLTGAALSAVSALQELVLVIGDLGVTDALTAIFRGAAQALRDFASALPGIVDALGDILRTLSVVFAPVLLLKFNAILNATIALVFALRAAFISLAFSNPFIAIITLVSAAVLAIRQFSDVTFEINGQTVSLGALFETIWGRFSTLVEQAASLAGLVFRSVFKGISAIFSTFINAIISGVNFLRRRVGQTEFRRFSFQDLFPESVKKGVQDIVNEAAARTTGEPPAAITDQARIQQQVAQTQNTQSQTQTTRENTAAAKANNDQLERQRRLLDEIKGPQQNYEQDTRALISLLAQGKINTDQFEQATENLRLTFLDTQTDAVSGFERGLIRLQNTLNDTASLTEQALTNAFNAAEDAFVDFIRTGELDFRRLTDSILSDLARIAFRQAISGIIGAAIPGGNLGSSFAGAFQSGGVIPGGRFGLVGEAGPELISAGRAPLRVTPISSNNSSENFSFQQNIVNQSGSEVSTSQRRGPQGQFIQDVVIAETRGAIADGAFDESMRGRFTTRPRVTGR